MPLNQIWQHDKTCPFCAKKRWWSSDGTCETNHDKKWHSDVPLPAHHWICVWFFLEAVKIESFLPASRIVNILLRFAFVHRTPNKYSSIILCKTLSLLNFSELHRHTWWPSACAACPSSSSQHYHFPRTHAPRHWHDVPAFPHGACNFPLGHHVHPRAFEALPVGSHLHCACSYQTDFWLV